VAKDALIKDQIYLADALVDVVDDIRREVHGALGTRPWRVEIITRRWSGEERGVGTPTITVLKLDPIPRVTRVSRDRLGPAGREASGTIVMENVSLRYQEQELQPPVDARTEVAYRLTELHGQNEIARWFVLSASPIPRRGDKKGDQTDWYLLLNETSPMGDFDGVDAP
jgi:hypothetical protein